MHIQAKLGQEMNVGHRTPTAGKNPGANKIPLPLREGNKKSPTKFSYRLDHRYKAEAVCEIYSGCGT